MVDLIGDLGAWPFIGVDVLAEGVEEELAASEDFPFARRIDGAADSVDLLVSLSCVTLASASAFGCSDVGTRWVEAGAARTHLEKKSCRPRHTTGGHGEPRRTNRDHSHSQGAPARSGLQAES